MVRRFSSQAHTSLCTRTFKLSLTRFIRVVILDYASERSSSRKIPQLSSHVQKNRYCSSWRFQVLQYIRKFLDASWTLASSSKVGFKIRKELSSPGMSEYILEWNYFWQSMMPDGNLFIIIKRTVRTCIVWMVIRGDSVVGVAELTISARFYIV